MREAADCQWRRSPLLGRAGAQGARVHRRALLLLAATCILTQAGAQQVLVLRRDWTPSSCFNIECRPHPDSFSIDAFYLSQDGTQAAQQNCRGPLAPGADADAFAPAALQAANISRAELSCAWQNYDPDRLTLDPVWEYQWQAFGACTPFANPLAYLRAGKQLDQRYPLPQDLPENITGARLEAAVTAAFGVRPVVECGDGWLSNIQLCFSLEGLAPVDCPATTSTTCAGPLRLPRDGRGVAECAFYYPPSPVAYDPRPPPLPPPTQPPPGPPPPAPAPLPPPVAPPPAPVPLPPPAPVPLPPPAPVPAPAPAPALAPAPVPEPEAVPEPQPVPAPAPADPSPPAEAPADDGAAAPPPEGGAAAPAPALEPSAEGPPGEAEGQGESVPPPTSGGTSSGSMAAALGGGIAGGIVVGLAALAGGWTIYKRAHAPRLAGGGAAASVKSVGGGGGAAANGGGYSDSGAYAGQSGYGAAPQAATAFAGQGGSAVSTAAAGAAAAGAGGLAAAGSQPAGLGNGGGGSDHWSVHAPQYEAWAGSAEEGLLASQQAPPPRFTGHLPGAA